MTDVFKRLLGTVANFFRIGLNGPQLKNNGGVLETRSADDSTYAILRAAAPSGNDDLVTKAYGDTNYLGGGGSYGEVVTVAKSGGEHTTIAAGLAAAVALSPSPTNPILVHVYPGVYTEPALSVPAYVSLRSAGGFATTVINAATSTQLCVTLNVGAALVGFTVTGASGSGGKGIYTVGSTSVRLCYVKNCETAIDCVGAQDTFIVQCVVRRLSGETMQDGLRVRSGARVLAPTMEVSGVSGYPLTGRAVWVEGTGTQLSVEGLYQLYAQYGVSVDNAAYCRVIGHTVNQNTYGVHIGSTGSGTILHIEGVVTDANNTYDVFIENADASFYFREAVFRRDRVGHPTPTADTVWRGGYHNEQPAREGYHILGDLQVGYYLAGSTSHFGEGPPHPDSLLVYTNTNGEAGTWVDRTAEAVSPSGSAFNAFPGSGVNNCFYVGCSIDFPAIYVVNTTAITLGTGAIVWEYWNGASWVQFNVLATTLLGTREQYAQKVFERTNGNEAIRFGELPGWNVKSLNGSTRYWVRCRIATAITGPPVIEQILVATNCCRIGAKGVLTYYGDARPWRGLGGFSLASKFEVSGYLPTDENILLSAANALDAYGNQFSDAALDAIGGIIVIPPGLDTSLPLRLSLAWAPYSSGGTGYVEWEIAVCEVIQGTLLNGSLPEIVRSEIVGGPSTGDQVVLTTIDIPTPNVVPGNFLGFRIYRDGTAGNTDDTFNRDVYLAAAQLAGRFWL